MDDFQNSTCENIEIRCNNIIAICRNVAFGGGGFQVEVRNIVDSVIKSNYNLSFKNNSISKIASSAVINLYKCKERKMIRNVNKLKAILMKMQKKYFYNHNSVGIFAVNTNGYQSHE